MKLIANKPCSFGGQQFYIGGEIPAELVADAKMQERLGVITIVNDDVGVLGGQLDTLFTQEQVDKMIAEAVAESKINVPLGELAAVEIETGAYEGKIIISVKGPSEGENEMITAVPVSPEEIQQVFFIMQLSAEEGVNAISEVQSENVLILIHAVDSRKTVKAAARQRANKLFPEKDEADGGNEETGAREEGVDT